MIKSDTAIHTAYDDHKPLDPAEPEKNLMRAVLRCAMDDISRSGEPYRDARNFFLLEDEFYIYSFKSICYHLDLCEKTIRQIVGLAETAHKQSTSQNAKPEGEPCNDGTSVDS